MMQSKVSLTELIRFCELETPSTMLKSKEKKWTCCKTFWYSLGRDILQDMMKKLFVPKLDQVFMKEAIVIGHSSRGCQPSVAKSYRYIQESLLKDSASHSFQSSRHKRRSLQILHSIEYNL